MVWPDNWDAVGVFASMQTQWRIGPAGVTGLDYAGLEGVMRLSGVKKRDRQDVFECVRVMEAEALKAMREE